MLAYMRKADIHGLIRQFDSIETLAIKIREEYISTRNGFPLYPGTGPRSFFFDIKELCEQYNDAIKHFDSVKGDSTTQLKKCHISPRGWNMANLTQIIVGCNKALGVLNKLISPALTRDEIDKINSLRNELEKISPKINVNFEKNIEESLKEYEKGHYLASALISSRVIICSLNKIPGDTDEEKAKYLRREKKIGKGRKDTAQQFLKASRIARNVGSHDIKIFPTPAEALSLLSDSISIVEFLPSKD
jgi:hypothetical protein